MTREEIKRKYPLLEDWLRLLQSDGPVPGIDWRMVAGWALAALASPSPEPTGEREALTLSMDLLRHLYTVAGGRYALHPDSPNPQKVIDAVHAALAAAPAAPPAAATREHVHEWIRAAADGQEWWRCFCGAVRDVPPPPPPAAGPACAECAAEQVTAGGRGDLHIPDCHHKGPCDKWARALAQKALATVAPLIEREKQRSDDPLPRLDAPPPAAPPHEAKPLAPTGGPTVGTSDSGEVVALAGQAPAPVGGPPPSEIVCELYFALEDRGLVSCYPETSRDGGKPGAPVHANACGTFRPEACPMCAARAIYLASGDTTAAPAAPAAPPAAATREPLVWGNDPADGVLRKMTPVGAEMGNWHPPDATPQPETPPADEANVQIAGVSRAFMEALCAGRWRIGAIRFTAGHGQGEFRAYALLAPWPWLREGEDSPYTTIRRFMAEESAKAAPASPPEAPPPPTPVGRGATACPRCGHPKHGEGRMCYVEIAEGVECECSSERPLTPPGTGRAPAGGGSHA